MSDYASEAGHWYTQTGEPAYETEAADGTLRPTNLRDARKQGLLPSVTGIIRCAAAPGLENWKQDRLLEASLAYPMGSTEAFESYCRRVKAAQREEAAKAPHLGTAIHIAIERCLEGKEHAFQDHVASTLRALRGWCGDQPYQSEKSFAHHLGFGGRVDIHKRELMVSTAGFVGDYKTTEFSADDLPKTWPNHSMQLSACREGLGMGDARCAIIFVSTSEPGLVHLVEISNAELERGWRMFRALLAYWQDEKQYYPNLKPEKGTEHESERVVAVI